MLSIKQRLLTINQELLSAVSEGGPAIERFSDDWLRLQKDVTVAVDAALLDEDTVFLAHTVSSTVAICASAFHDLYTEYQQLTSEMVSELELTFSRLSLSESALPTTTGCDRAATLTSSLVDNVGNSKLLDSILGVEPFEQAASCWLLSNLHNPYPSRSLKAALARSSEVDVQFVSRWFSDIRNQIGWNTLRRDFFQGSRDKTIHAAHEVFLESNQRSEHSPEVIQAFSAIRTEAISLAELVFQTARSQSVQDEFPWLDTVSPARRYTSLTPSLTPSSSSMDDVPSRSTSPWSSQTPSSASCKTDEDEKDLACTAARKRSCALMEQLSNDENMETHKRLKNDALSISWESLSDVVEREHVCNSIQPRVDIPCKFSTTSIGGYGGNPESLKTRRKRSIDDDADVVSTKRLRLDKDQDDILSQWFETLPMSIKASAEDVPDSTSHLEVQLFSDWQALCTDHVAVPRLPNVPSGELPGAAETLCDPYDYVCIPSQTVPQEYHDDFLHSLLNEAYFTADSCDPGLPASSLLCDTTAQSNPSNRIVPAVAHNTSPEPSPENYELQHLQRESYRTSTALPLDRLCSGSTCPPYLDIDFADTAQSPFDIPPPSFLESIGDVSANWNDFADLNHSYNEIISPPPYEISTSSSQVLHEVSMTKIGSLDAPECGIMPFDVDWLNFLQPTVNNGDVDPCSEERR